MFSLMSCSALVMKRLTPSMRQEPSAFGKALVRPAPTSEPASGSVRTMVAPHWRSIMISAIRFCSSLPRCHRMAAKPGPAMYMKAAGVGETVWRGAGSVEDAEQCDSNAVADLESLLQWRE